MSLDGFGAAPNQDIDDPLGEDDLQLHDWMVTDRTFRRRLGLIAANAGPTAH